MKTKDIYLAITILIGFCLVVVLMISRAYIREPISDETVTKVLDGYVQTMSGWNSFAYSVTSLNRASHSSLSEANDVWCIVIKPPVIQKIGTLETMRQVDHWVLILPPNNQWVAFGFDASEQDFKNWKESGCNN